MSGRPREVTQMHSHLLRCALEVEDSRAYWAHAEPGREARAHQAFDEYWFGARSLARIEVLLSNMRARFDAFPHGLAVLRRWPEMSPDVRRVICHWHLQLADPLYRQFTGAYLVERRNEGRPGLTRDLVAGWVAQEGPESWTTSTQIQCASKLLSASYSAGLVASNRDPRPLSLPRVPDEALEYLMYLLREVDFAGTLRDNPYARSVGLEPENLDDRLRALDGVTCRKQGDLVDFVWRYPNLPGWAADRLGHPLEASAEGVV